MNVFITKSHNGIIIKIIKKKMDFYHDEKSLTVRHCTRRDLRSRRSQSGNPARRYWYDFGSFGQMSSNQLKPFASCKLCETHPNNSLVLIPILDLSQSKGMEWMRTWKTSEIEMHSWAFDFFLFIHQYFIISIIHRRSRDDVDRPAGVGVRTVRLKNIAILKKIL